MFESLRKKAFKKVLVSSIIFFIIGLALVIFMGKHAFYAVFGYVTFEDLEPDQIHNQLVDLSMTQAIDSFMYEEEVNSDTGRRISVTSYYYAFYTGGENLDLDYAIMAIKVPSAYHSTMDEIADYYYENKDFYPTPLHLSGEIKKMSDEELQYFKEYFNISDAEFNEFCIPYYVNVFKNKTSENIMAILICGAGIALFIVGIVRIIRSVNGSSLKKLKEDLAEIGCSEASAESDYNSAVSYVKNGDTKIGRLFTYYMSGSSPRAIPNTKLLWAYQITTTHRTNGIKTGTTYSVMLYVDDSRNSVVLHMPSESVTHEALNKINQTFPWVVVGYSDELKKMFNKERSRFMSLRYNAVEHVAAEPGFESMYNS